MIGVRKVSLNKVKKKKLQSFLNLFLSQYNGIFKT